MSRLSLRIQTLLKVIFFTGVFFLPFVFWPWARVPYEIPRVWFFQRWVEVLAAVTVLSTFREAGGKSLRFRRIHFLILTFLVIAIVSSIFGSDFGKSWLGNYWRADGLITLFHLIALFVCLSIVWKRDWEAQLVKIVAFSSLAISGWAILNEVQFLFNFHRFVPVGISFGQPKFLGGYLLVTVPFVLAWISTLQVKSRLLIIFSVVMAIFLSGSVISLLLVLVFLFVKVFVTHFSWQQRTLAVGVFLFAGIGVYYLVGVKNKVLYQIQPGHFAFEGRWRILNKLALGISDRPILGWGWTNVDYAFEAHDWPIKINSDVYLDKAHSSILEVLVTTGVIGLAIYLLIVLEAGKPLRKTVFIAPLILFLVHSQTNVISISEEVIFWIILGIAGSKASAEVKSN